MRSIRNCPVACVGGAGFLGSHLVDHLIEDRGCTVLVIDNLVSGRREFIHRDAEFEHADITASESHLLHLFRDYGIRFVFCYAARPYVPDSYARPLRTFDVNAMGALKVINAAQEAGVEAVLQVSSAELYGGTPIWNNATGELESESSISEHEPVEPHSTYGASKAAIDALVQVRWREAKTPCIALRQFNCVGPRETHPYVIPDIISQLAASKAVDGVHTIKLGNNSTRDFLYAGDQARMAVELLERGEFGAVYNLGSETGIKIYDLAQMIADVMGYGKVRIEQDPARVRAWEIWSLCASCEKIYGVIEARPQVPLEEALRRTVAYYEANGRKWVWER